MGHCMFVFKHTTNQAMPRKVEEVPTQLAVPANAALANLEQANQAIVPTVSQGCRRQKGNRRKCVPKRKCRKRKRRRRKRKGCKKRRRRRKRKGCKKRKKSLKHPSFDSMVRGVIVRSPRGARTARIVRYISCRYKLPKSTVRPTVCRTLQRLNSQGKVYEVARGVYQLRGRGGWSCSKNKRTCRKRGG